MDGQKILKLFRENKRLAKPSNCPDDIYQLMWSCWQLRSVFEHDDDIFGYSAF